MFARFAWDFRVLCPCLIAKSVDFAVLAATALGCRVNETSIFARKNYFYPDLPKGYQISQYDKPLAEFGAIEIVTAAGARKIGITRLHLEEDAGKSLHEGFADSTETTAIDLNRSGVPLIEIVSEPDIASPAEAYEYLTRLKEIILYTGVSDCNMEEGSLRCDANVSVRPRGQKQFGTKTEIKNVNSFRFIREALEYEIDRQIGIVESGGKITQETRLYNSAEGKTYGMRSKEQAHDYRYFPEPDLLPLVVDEKWQAEIRSALPELPEARRKRMVADYGITEYDAQVLTVARSFADQFEAAAKAAKNPKRVANLVQGELMGRLKAKGMEIEQSPISMKGVALSADLVESGAISGKMLKDLYDLSFEQGKDFGEDLRKGKATADNRFFRDRKDHRRNRSREPKAGGAISRGQEDGNWLLCRPSDEGLEGAGKPADGKRTANEKAGELTDTRESSVMFDEVSRLLSRQVVIQSHQPLLGSDEIS